MDLPNYKSTVNRSPPFRATQLWNEAVSSLQNGMPTRRHFYRMRYYDNCFSGKEGVEWLSKTLLNNPRFGTNVTKEGTRKLLQHFLKTGVFQSVKGSLVFKESGLYEFVDRTIASPSRKQDHKAMFSHVGLKEVNPNIPQEIRGHSKFNEKQPSHFQHSLSPFTANKTPSRFSQRLHDPTNKTISWKDFVLRRIHSLVPTLSVELLLDPTTVQSDWIMYNMCPEFDNIRKKTELPFWVFTAVSSVVRPQEKESEEYTTYAGFEKDVYAVVRDYLRHRSSPMIPYSLYELVMYTFNHFHFLDLEMKNRSRERESLENLVLSMSHEWNEDHMVGFDDLTKTVLPPNSCFETAFTSDKPVTRIVPQSSVDTLCLGSQKMSKTTSSSKITQDVKMSQTIIYKNCKEPTKVNTRSENPAQERPIDKFKSRKKANILRRTRSMAQIDGNTKYSTLPVFKAANSCSKDFSSQYCQQSYVNYGLSQSLDDLLVIDDNVGLDFEEAMQSVNSLMRASCKPKSKLSPSSSVLDINSSSLESLSTVNSFPSNKASLVCIDSCVWYEDILETARQVFHSVLMLMPPVSRTTLRMLLQFIDCLPVHPDSSISKTEIVYDLSAHILSPGPHNKNVYSHHMVLSVVYFLVDNYMFIFEDFPEKELTIGCKEVLKENRPAEGQKVYCEQLTKNQFEDQGITSSWLALAELLDQIINDKKMKSKEKKKRLKKFKEAYPHIYKQRFGSSSTNLASLVHFR